MIIISSYTMKFYETHFEDYCKSNEKLLENDPTQITNINMDMSKNIIVYGSTGVGKYTQVLAMLKPYSSCQLKYDKKIKASTDKQSYTYRISDIHYEIDMSLLGCNSKIIWHEIYCQIIDIITIKPEKIGFIVCKNFHAIHNELLEIFYSYMQKHCYGYDGKSREIQVRFILITEHLSFLPNNILNHCQIMGIQRPSKEDIIKIANINKTKEITPIMDQISTKDIINIKEVYSFSLINSIDKLPNDHFNTVCDTIIQEMINLHQQKYDYPGIAFFRDCLYDILIYNLDSIECIWHFYQHFVDNGFIISKDKNDKFIQKLANILKQYGNNYRSIFHIEHAIFSMMEAFD
jgi:hypothetical protein